MYLQIYQTKKKRHFFSVGCMYQILFIMFRENVVSTYLHANPHSKTVLCFPSRVSFLNPIFLMPWKISVRTMQLLFIFHSPLKGVLVSTTSCVALLSRSELCHYKMYHNIFSDFSWYKYALLADHTFNNEMYSAIKSLSFSFPSNISFSFLPPYKGG